jgi:hypothetical protein
MRSGLFPAAAKARMASRSSRILRCLMNGVGGTYSMQGWCCPWIFTRTHPSATAAMVAENTICCMPHGTVQHAVPRQRNSSSQTTVSRPAAVPPGLQCADPERDSAARPRMVRSFWSLTRRSFFSLPTLVFPMASRGGLTTSAPPTGLSRTFDFTTRQGIRTKSGYSSLNAAASRSRTWMRRWVGVDSGSSVYTTDCSLCVIPCSRHLAV